MLRRHRRHRATRWCKLSAGRQALLVLPYLRKDDTYADLAGGARVGISTVRRYLREAIGLLAAMVPIMEQAIEVARRILPKIRSSASDAGQLVAAVQTLMIAST